MAATTPVYWIHDRASGGLAIAPRPRGGEWLVDEVHAWRLAGVEIVVSLLMTAEQSELGLDEERRLCQTEGIEFLHLPLPDRDVPHEREAFEILVLRLREALRAGRRIVIHCRQGIGRSSLLAASVLVSEGDLPDDALHRVESARGRPVPDTDEQRSWVQARTPAAS